MNRSRWGSLALVAAAVGWALAPLVAPRRPGLDARGFGELPVLHEGRLKPLDTVARSSLLLISGRQSLPDAEGSLGADQWLLDVLTRPEKADGYRIFTVDHPDLLALADLPASSDRRFSFADIIKARDAIERQVQAAEAVDPSRRSSFQEAILDLSERMVLYMRLKNTLWLPSHGSMAAGLEHLVSAGKDPKRTAEGMSLLAFMTGEAVFRPVASEDCSPGGFVDVGSAEIAALHGAVPAPGLAAFARLHDAAAAKDALAFNMALSSYRAALDGSCPRQTAWAGREALFNRVEPFYRGLVLYLLSILLLLAGWLLKRAEVERAAVSVALAAFAIHTAGLVFRTALQGRPPVTNLYSSAVFVGWAAVAAGLIFQRVYRRSLATLAADVIGFSTLIIAHHLQSQGDTIEMMRAVLDSNFWLTTHVVTITMGYGACFLASALGHVALVKLALRREGGQGSEVDALVDMIYASLCAALLLSFVGTALGGIWADRSWGRFWGWDPKENGALLIVLWNAMALHARWAGMIRQKGLIVMAVLGGIVTSLAWFGVNMLGVGLHSYGFTASAFYALSAVIAAELAFLAGVLSWPARAPQTARHPAARVRET